MCVFSLLSLRLPWRSPATFKFLHHTLPIRTIASISNLHGRINIFVYPLGAGPHVLSHGILRIARLEDVHGVAAWWKFVQGMKYFFQDGKSIQSC
jgi:hypothetical protein